MFINCMFVCFLLCQFFFWQKKKEYLRFLHSCFHTKRNPPPPAKRRNVSHRAKIGLKTFYWQTGKFLRGTHTCHFFFLGGGGGVGGHVPLGNFKIQGPGRAISCREFSLNKYIVKWWFVSLMYRIRSKETTSAGVWMSS